MLLFGLCVECCEVLQCGNFAWRLYEIANSKFNFIFPFHFFRYVFGHE